MCDYSFNFIFSIIKRLVNGVIVCNTKAGKFNVIRYIVIICNAKAGKSNIAGYVIIVYNTKAGKFNIAGYTSISVALFRN